MAEQKYVDVHAAESVDWPQGYIHNRRHPPPPDNTKLRKAPKDTSDYIELYVDNGEEVKLWREVNGFGEIQKINVMGNNSDNALRGWVRMAHLYKNPKLDDSAECLIVEVLGATDLLNMDSWLQGVSDPYVQLELRGDNGAIKAKARTATTDNNLDPLWNETFSFRFFEPRDELLLRVMDDDSGYGPFGGEDDQLGKYEFKAAELKVAFDGEVTLHDAGEKQGKSKLRLRIRPPAHGPIPMSPNAGLGEERFGFKVREYIMWQGSSPEIPERGIGQITGFCQDRLLAAYPGIGCSYLLKPGDCEKYEPHTLRLVSLGGRAPNSFSMCPCRRRARGDIDLEAVLGIYQRVPCIKCDQESSSCEHVGRAVYKQRKPQRNPPFFLYYWGPERTWQIGHSHSNPNAEVRSHNRHEWWPTHVREWRIKRGSSFASCSLEAQILEGRANHWCVLQYFAPNVVECEFYGDERHAEARWETVPSDVGSMWVGPGGVVLRYSVGCSEAEQKEIQDWYWEHLDDTHERVVQTDLKQMFCVVENADWGIENCDGEFFQTATMAWHAATSIKSSRMIIGPAGLKIRFFGQNGGRDKEMMDWWKRAVNLPVDELDEITRRAKKEAIFLNVYDVVDNAGVHGINRLLKVIGSGAYHAGVQVHGLEFSYGGFPEDCRSPADAPGYFTVQPMACPFGRYIETIYLGRTDLSLQEIDQMLFAVRSKWRGRDYDLTTKNCCHFSDAFSKTLTGKGIPGRVLNLAGAGAAFVGIAAEGRDDPAGGNPFGDFTRGLFRRIRRMTCEVGQ